MREGVFSFDTMREACLTDQPAGWRHFVKTYAPVARHLLRHYFPAQEQAALLGRVVREAKANQAQVWRSFAGTSEKEFLLHLRGFVLREGRAARGTVPETPLTPENFWALLEPFPALQREMLVLSFRGYTPEELSVIMKFLPETTRAAVERARKKLRTPLGAGLGPDIEKRDHDALFAAIETQRGEKCVLDKTYVRFVDGQVTWREREDAERHIENCLYCLNRFAEFREVFHFFRTLPPAEDNDVAELFVALGLPAQEPVGKKRAWWQRLLGG